MKAINRITIVIMTMLTAITASALTPDEVLNKASQTINSAKSITAKFGGSADGTLVVSGQRFSMVAGGLGVWFNGTDMWTYSKRTGETSLTTPTKSELMESNPMEIIKNYGAKFAVAKVSEGSGKYTVKLTPKTKTDKVRTATVTINTRTWLPEGVDIVFDNGSRMTVNITSITEGEILGSAQFNYPKDKYPGVEIIDLR